MSQCKVCSVHITDEVLKHTYFDPDFPDIDIGPYCQECLSKIRICDGCHHPKVLNQDIQYFGNATHFCTECAQDLEVCDYCNLAHLLTHEDDSGNKICHSCFTDLFNRCTHCDAVKGKRNFSYSVMERARHKELFEEHDALCHDCFALIKDDYNQCDVNACARCLEVYAITSESHSKYCPECAPTLPSCDECGELTHDYKRLVADGLHLKICKSCRPKYKECSSCGDYSKTFFKIRGKVSSTEVCKKCHSDEIRECPSCLKFAVFQGEVCSSCKTYFYDSNCSECKQRRDSFGNCRSCSTPTKVYDYTFRPPITFNYTDLDEKRQEYLFFGIENEVTMESYTKKNNALKSIYKNFDPSLVHCKYDASIHGSGFEIVTQPMTLDFFQKLDISKLFRRSYRVDNSCGMHIHVGRNGFSGDLHMYKVINFIHSNTDFINQVAGRDYNEYNQQLLDKVSSTIKEAKFNRRGTSRRLRVNLSNKQTVEFRMFAGCTNQREMKSRVEFIHALIIWTRDISLINTSVEDFIKFVEVNKDTYSFLYKIIKKSRG
jgi:hypothetical protein